ncbi:uncharacterized protein N7511_009987 [Penicillium nucicola]|uniref:uncharacterized protein n=1 Tax=Penicillium nucicola TaxID=1850975 RepID=UPI002545921B|nr:uncharacterized protein N7511_009987 [Penicillium nucicola]KAJ5748291.1 hypothetical protein N7511_009987 [Penicillium nucicola]
MEPVIRHKDRAEVQRRKTRKGTQSCWECKKRKVRCIFSSSAHSCNNCRRRGSTCISQEYPDKPVSASSNKVEGRLRRVEDLLDRLRNKNEACPEIQTISYSASATPEDAEDCQPGIVSPINHTVDPVEVTIGLTQAIFKPSSRTGSQSYRSLA